MEDRSMLSQRLTIEMGKLRISVPGGAVPLFLISATICFVVWVLGNG